jgi:hypothetical protein
MKTCRAPNCEKVVMAKGLCREHYDTLRRTGRLHRVYKMYAQREPFSYFMCHVRLWNARGKANELICVDCEAEGVIQLAHHWGYSYQAHPADEMIGLDNNGNPAIWSKNVMDYDPLCRSHHRKRDVKYNKELRLFADKTGTHSDLINNGKRASIKT